MRTTTRVGVFTLLLLALSLACARSPDVGKFTCTSRAHCPDGYVCTGSPAAVGKCVRITATLDATPPADGLQPSPGLDVATPIDGPGGAALDGADVPIGGADSNVDGYGGTVDGPGTGGAGGNGGSVGVTGGISGGGGQAGGAAGTGGTKDAAMSTGGAGGGDGGTAPPPTGIGGATGGNGIGGNQTGGVPGTGGVPPGTGGSTPGTGGSTPGTGGNTPGTGGSTPGTGGNTPGTGGSAPGGATVNLDQTHQTIEGFGLNTALGGGSVPWDTFYSTSGSGLGLSIVRVGMNPSGSLSGSVPPASYNAKVIGTTWSAPATCKDNGNTTKGGHLVTSCYDSWSTTIANFAKTQGLYAMSVQSDPDFASCGSSIGPPCNGDYESMVYTANEMVDFVKVLGPKLKTAGIKLIAPEPQEWIHLWSNTSGTGSLVSSHPNSSDPLKCGCFGNTPTSTGCSSTCASGGGYDYGHWLARDATAWASIDILGVHEYDTQKAEPWPSDVDGGKPSKEVWMTEMSGTMYWPEQGASSDINNGVAVAEWIHSALVVGEASAWLYFWYQANGSDNEGLVVSGSTALTKRCYTLGNYSKFVRPGYVRVNTTGAVPTDVLLSAYECADGTVVVVAINKGSAAPTVPITISGGTLPASCTPYVTSSTDNLAAKTVVTVSGGTFTATLAATTVTTFVCK